jgi:hypothetical protein
MKKLKNDVADTIKDIDMFGHPIELNFNNKGSTHNTIVGGFFSIFIRSFLTFYVFYNIYQMCWYQNNTVRQSTFTLSADADSDQTVNNILYENMRSKLFIVIRWQI